MMRRRGCSASSSLHVVVGAEIPKVASSLPRDPRHAAIRSVTAGAHADATYDQPVTRRRQGPRASPCAVGEKARTDILE